MSKEQIPVVPAAHYMCGGLKSSVKGNTEIPGLYVAGELAHTGLHGANRLASNSLLEAVVMGRFVAVEIDKYVKNTDLFYNIPNWKTSGTLDNDENVVIKQNWDEIRHVMWNYVGIVRSDKRLKRALKRINLIKEEITEYYWNVKISKNLLELRNLTLVAEIIIRSAMKRKESRGLHYSIDYPEISPVLKNTEILPEEI
jgi:L-aspartate oxidase